MSENRTEQRAAAEVYPGISDFFAEVEKGRLARMGSVQSIIGLGPIDGRSREARMYRRAVAEITNALGESNLRFGQRELVKRAAGLIVMAARIERHMLNGENLKHGDYLSIVRTLGRVLARLGLANHDTDHTDWSRP